MAHATMDEIKAAAERLASELEIFRTATRRVTNAQANLLDRLTAASAREGQWLNEKSQLQEELASVQRQLGLSRPRDVSPESVVHIEDDVQPCAELPVVTATSATKLNASPQLLDESENFMSSIAALFSKASTILSNTFTGVGKEKTQQPIGFLVVKGVGLEANPRKIQFCSPIITRTKSLQSKRSRVLFESLGEEDDDGQIEDKEMYQENVSPVSKESEENLPIRPYKQRKAKDYALAAMISFNSDFNARSTDKSDNLESRKRELTNHALYGRGLCQRWIDIEGRCRLSFGVIRARCESNGTCPLYEVEYPTEPLDNEGTEVRSTTTSHVGLVSEKMVWGGHLTYLQLMGAELSTDEKMPFHVVSLQPTIWMIDSEERLIIEIRGFQLVFTVAPSGVAEAGLGLYVYVTERTIENRQYLHLKHGEMIGLGRYAPLGETDGKSEIVFLMKNFIHEFQPSVYAFQARRSGCEVFDLTDDKTGKLHENAEVSHLVRVNETDGIECPSVIAEYDPSGGIQYYLGHGEPGQGDLKIPVNEPFELKVDYSEAYETIRVTQDYARVKGKELEAMQQTINDRDRSALLDFSVCNPIEIEDCISFLERLFDPASKTNPVQLHRTLVVALTLRNRAEALKKKGDVDDVKRLSDLRIGSRVRRVIRFICIGIGGVSELKDAISSLSILKDAFAEYIGFLSQDDLKLTDFTSLLSTLWNPDPLC